MFFAITLNLLCLCYDFFAHLPFEANSHQILWILNILCEGIDSLSQMDAVAALVRSEAIFALPPPNLPETPLMMSMGVIFAMIVVFFGLVNCSKMGSVFLRNDIGIPSESFFAKMKRFYQACECKVTTRKSGFQIFRKFMAFRNVKISSLLQCLLGKNLFFVSQKCTNLEMSFDAKMTPLANLTIEARNRPICTLLVTVKK